ncbi:hypothetical protein ACFL2Z_02745 [Candidatus Eisenbacteria bacterium]|uniref:ABC-type uncharacterized transport system domain-containing protein n=1 Tax=Eiseniibacteriota bacterium TaxID=2212470 RepID=A0ABV6YP10_UNCEI
MGSESATERNRLGPDHPFRVLYAQAGKRWLIFLAALAALIWLGLFAGTVRNPGGVKRRWAVVASRAMAAVGGIIVVRLLLFSDEERVPVLYMRADAISNEALAAWIGRLRGREDLVVPLSDVMAFMADRRYVPKGGLGLVLKAGTIEEAETLASIAGDIEITILLPAGTFDKIEQDGMQLPDSVAIGMVLDSGLASKEDLRAALKRFAKGARLHLGKSPVCVAPGDDAVTDPDVLAGAGGYASYLGGGGYNRFGDRPYLIRPLDLTPVISLGRMTGLNTRVYAGMFRGGHIWWPLAALLKAIGASPGWR